MASFVDIYRNIAKIPEVTSAKINHWRKEKNEVSVSVNWSCRDLAKMKRHSLHSNYVVKDDIVISESVPTPLGKLILSSMDSKGEKNAYIYQDGDEQHVQIVGINGDMSTIDLKTIDSHGLIYKDVEFSCLEWSPDGTKLLYVAEKKQIKATNFFTKPKSDDCDGRGKEHLFLDDWGEQLTGQHQSVVVVLDVIKESVDVHAMEDGFCPAQLIWTPDGDGIIGVAYVASPFKLGLIYCRNRSSFLFHMDLSGNYSRISLQDDNYIQSPRFSPDGTKLVYMKSPVGGPHIRGAQLVKLTWPEKLDSVLLDYVSSQRKISCGGDFWGLVGSTRLTRRCWLSDNRHVIFSTVGPHREAIYILDTENGDVRSLKQYPSGSAVLKDVQDKWVTFIYSSLTEPEQVNLGRLSDDCSELSVIPLTTPLQLGCMQVTWKDAWHIKPHYKHPNEKLVEISIPILYIGPTKQIEGSGKRPLIVMPHGGPHSCNSNVYLHSATFLVNIGYSVLLVNYRGSLGSGTDGIDSLPGYCGTVDVDDTYQAVLSCIQRFPNVVDSTRIGLYGGSHGGFLVTHLAGQYPDTFKAVSTRNPVVDISAMTTISDISDWCYVETGHNYTHKDIADGDVLTKMLSVSPICHIDKVKTPMLFLIGKNDRRVPPCQGIYYHKKLLARGIPTKLMIYDDCHPLRKVDVEADCLLNTAAWFQEYV